MPSGNKSLLGHNFKHVSVLIANEPSDHLSFLGPFAHVLGYWCETEDGGPDNCGRALFSGSHVLALLLILFCYKWLRRSVINDTPYAGKLLAKKFVKHCKANKVLLLFHLWFQM